MLLLHSVLTYLQATSDDPHYEFQQSSQVSPYEVEEDTDPYWEPASREDELRMQLAGLGVVEIPRQNVQ